MGGAQGVLEVGEVIGVGELILPISQDWLPHPLTWSRCRCPERDWERNTSTY